MKTFSIPNRWISLGKHGILSFLFLISISVLGFYSYSFSQPIFKAHYHNQTDQIIKKILPDGSSLELEPSSAIRLTFYERSRLAELQTGRVAFELTEQPIPLKVSVGDLRLEIATGQVLLQQQEEGGVVQVLKGQVQAIVGKWWPDRHELQAGQSLNWTN